MSKTVYQNVDFSGDALYNLEHGMFSAIFSGDFRFVLDAIDTEVVFQRDGVLIFKAPLGENSFTAIGECHVSGIISTNSQTKEHRLIMEIFGREGDFVGVNGFLEVFWMDGDDSLHFGGTLYF